MESRLHGLTTKELKAIAHNLADRNYKLHPFCGRKQEAGKHWVQDFLKMHAELSIRKRESTLVARAAGFNREVVEQFYNFLDRIYDEHHLTLDWIYNCDETGIQLCPKRN